jgi:hypothetical protein
VVLTQMAHEGSPWPLRTYESPSNGADQRHGSTDDERSGPIGHHARKRLCRGDQHDDESGVGQHHRTEQRDHPSGNAIDLLLDFAAHQIARVFGNTPPVPSGSCVARTTRVIPAAMPCGMMFLLRNGLPAICANMSMIAPKLLSTTQRNVSRAKPVPRMTHAGWELEQDSVRVRC